MLGAHPQEDLLSVARRLLDPVQSTQFSHFAGMLDREAYGAAFAAHLFRQKGDWSRAGRKYFVVFIALFPSQSTQGKRLIVKRAGLMHAFFSSFP